MSPDSNATHTDKRSWDVFTSNHFNCGAQLVSTLSRPVESFGARLVIDILDTKKAALELISVLLLRGNSNEHMVRKCDVEVSQLL